MLGLAVLPESMKMQKSGRTVCWKRSQPVPVPVDSSRTHGFFQASIQLSSSKYHLGIFLEDREHVMSVSRFDQDEGLLSKGVCPDAEKQDALWLFRHEALP